MYIYIYKFIYTYILTALPPLPRPTPQPPLPAAPAGSTYDLLQLRADWHGRAEKHSDCATGYEAQQPHIGHFLVKCDNRLLLRLSMKHDSNPL